MNGQRSEKRKAKSEKRKAAGSCFQLSAFSFPLSHRRGFTLIELLIVVTIIGMLASISLAALAQVRSVARVERTKATIAKINDVVMTRYASYVTRRVPMNTQGVAPVLAAQLRLQALRELMRMEMPERFQDIVFPKVAPDPNNPPTMADINQTITISASYTPSTGPTITATRSLSRSSLARRFFIRRVNSTSPQTDTYMSAEYLYLIVTLGDPDARDQFMDSEVGDADGDGWPEFIDGWGNPILFLRWAPGVSDSDVQTVVATIAGTTASMDATLAAAAAENDHDPFDGRKVDPDAWRLIPLIYSAGPDGIYDIMRDSLYPSTDVTVQPSWSDPFYFVDGATRNRSGLPVDSSSNDSVTNPLTAANGSLDHYDNIHNHRIEAD